MIYTGAEYNQIKSLQPTKIDKSAHADMVQLQV